MSRPSRTEAPPILDLRLLGTVELRLVDAARWLEVTPRTLRRRTDGPYRLDLADFERALADGDLQAAVDAYGGDLIDGSYDEWILEERERLRDRFADALERLEQRGDLAAAIDCAERLVHRHGAADPRTAPGGNPRARVRDRVIPTPVWNSSPSDTSNPP